MRKSSLRLAIAMSLLISTLWQPLALRAQDSSETFLVHAPMPLGVEAIRLEKAGDKNTKTKKTVYLLASVENQTLDGLSVTRAPHHGRVKRVDGSEVSTYPDALDFRVTATAIGNEFEGVDSYTLKTRQSLNDFLLGLKFRLKIFRGLEMVQMKPANVKLIGVPAYEPYEERVYRVSFETPKIPLDARIVLEIFSADGQRVTRFHLEML